MIIQVPCTNPCLVVPLRTDDDDDDDEHVNELFS